MAINLAIPEAPPVSQRMHRQLLKMSSNSLKTTKSAKTLNMCMLREHHSKARVSVYWARWALCSSIQGARTVCPQYCGKPIRGINLLLDFQTSLYFQICFLPFLCLETVMGIRPRGNMLMF